MTFQASAVLRAPGANLDQTERRAYPEKQVHQDRTVALDCWDLTDLQDNPAYVANRVQQGPKDHVVQTVVAVSPDQLDAPASLVLVDPQGRSVRPGPVDLLDLEACREKT